MIDSDKFKKKQENPEPVAYEVPSWSTWTRRLVTVILLIAGVYALTFVGSVINILLMSLLLVFILFTPARALTRRLRIPYPLSVFIIYFIFGIILMVGIFSFIPTVLTWAIDFTNSTVYVYQEIHDDWEDYKYEDGIVEIVNMQVDFNFVFEPIQRVMLGESILPEGSEDVPKNIIRADEIDIQAILNQTLSVVGTLTGAVSNIANILFQLIFIGLLSFLILLEIPIFYKNFYTELPTAYRREYGLLSLQILKVWNGFLRGEATIAILIGVITWLQFELMGIPGASVLGIFTGAISLIPTLGGLIALVPLSLVPLLQGSTVMTDANPLVLMFTVVVTNLVIQQFIWNVLAPKIIGDAVSVPLPFIIVGLFVGASVGGLLGAFLISPILGTIKVILNYVLHKLSDEDPYPQQPDPRLGEKDLFDPKVRIRT
jgi:predicted PurR-regulated permease PerM